MFYNFEVNFHGMLPEFRESQKRDANGFLLADVREKRNEKARNYISKSQFGIKSLIHFD